MINPSTGVKRKFEASLGVRISHIRSGFEDWIEGMFGESKPTQENFYQGGTNV